MITLAAGTACAATVWKWVDENGVVHYSDRPVEGAEVIELGSVQTFPGQQPGRAATRSRSSSATSSRQATQGRYRRFEVVRPEQQETLWNIGGTLEIELALDPSLAPEHRIDVFVDGTRRDIGATSTTFSVPEVFRGTHTLQAVIVDANGNDLLRSLAVTFHVQQTSIQNPNNTAPPARRN